MSPQELLLRKCHVIVPPKIDSSFSPLLSPPPDKIPHIRSVGSTKARTPKATNVLLLFLTKPLLYSLRSLVKRLYNDVALDTNCPKLPSKVKVFVNVCRSNNFCTVLQK